MRAIVIVIAALFAATLPACAPIQAPTRESAVVHAQAAVNEANAMLTAINITLRQRLEDGTMSAAEAARWLEKSRDLGRQADVMQSIIRAGAADHNVRTDILLDAIRALQRDLHERLGVGNE